AFSQTSLAEERTVAPCSLYSSSVKPLPSPAEVSTNTVCPTATKWAAPSGVKATRFSLFLISFGTPIIIWMFLSVYKSFHVLTYYNEWLLLCLIFPVYSFTHLPFFMLFLLYSNQNVFFQLVLQYT